MGFGKGFLWGVSGAAAQQEGGYDCDGKGLSIWDALIEGHVRNGDDARVACDHYHRYREDVRLLKELGVNTYRFSVSPARIYPQDGEHVNEKGLRFYVDLVHELQEAGIEPMCTLYHWDMPLWMHRAGGWQNPASVDWFARYAATVGEALGDCVRYWLTFNEPQIFVGCGYRNGAHAPFYTVNDAELHNITRNVLLAHGGAVKALRQKVKDARISLASTCAVLAPMETLSEPQAYEQTFDISRNGEFNMAWWCDPIYLGKAPRGCDWLSDDDLAAICQPLDYCAYNIYGIDNGGETSTAYPGVPRSAMGWQIAPECMYYSAKFAHRRYGLPIVITENGMANIDFVFEDGKVHDPQRGEYLRTHIRQLRRAADEGVPVHGYCCWSFLDNFEWAEGYDKRFGLVYVDYRTGERTVKDSAYVYRDIIRTNGDNL